MKSRELCIYLERIRSARNISQEDFVSDVVSIRQYRRYLNGESDIPYPVMDVLCDKLGIQTITLLKELETARNEETAKIDQLHNSLFAQNFDLFDKLNSSINESEIIDPENKLFYNHILLQYQLKQSLLNKVAYVEKSKELLGFPKFKKKTLYTMIEIHILASMLDYIESQKEVDSIFEKLIEQLSGDKLHLNDQYSHTVNIALFRLAKYSGIKERYQDVIHFCELGIKRNIKKTNFYLMDYFYYFSALSYFRLGDLEMYEAMLFKCFNVLYFEDLKSNIVKFTRWINKDFDIAFEDFAQQYINKLKSKQ